MLALYDNSPEWVQYKYRRKKNIKEEKGRRKNRRRA